MGAQWMARYEVNVFLAHPGWKYRAELPSSRKSVARSALGLSAANHGGEPSSFQREMIDNLPATDVAGTTVTVTDT